MIREMLLIVFTAVTSMAFTARASDADLAKEVDQLKKELDQMRKEKAADHAEFEAFKKQRTDAKAPIGTAKAAVENKYGPNAGVTSKQGKLTVGGLIQVWYYSIQNDNVGFFGDKPGTAATGVLGDTNEAKDNDSFSIRRAELRLTMDITENVTGYMMIDFVRPLAGRPAFPTNVGLFAVSDTTGPGLVQTPTYNSGLKMVQDVWVKYHGVVPHHDFTIGQYRPPLGEEGLRDNGQLDFAERSMIGQLGSLRDLGLTAHGTWWDDRFQYWLGAFNGAGDFFYSRSDLQNRVDDNDQKDFVWRLLVRPVWKHTTWGSLEVGVSGGHGLHGEAGDPGAPNGNVDGLNRRRARANRWYAWAGYQPGGPVKGWWLKGEWAWISDRISPGVVARFNANGFLDSAFGTVTAPNMQHATGFYVASGYKISESVFKDSAPGWLKNFEFLFRYEQFQNILVADLVDSTRQSDTFATDVWTFGFNYYIKGHNAKIQLNYNVVDNPDENSTIARTLAAQQNRPRHFRAVDNNNLLLNFQVYW